MAGYDGHRGWLYSLAVAEDTASSRATARALVASCRKRELARRGCPKVNLQIMSAKADVQAFYAKLGYHADDVVSLGKRLERA